MILICTSKVDVPADPTTNGDVPPRVALTFAADTFGMDARSGPLPSASLSVTLEADEAEQFSVGSRHVLGLDEAPTPGTAADAANQEPGEPPASKAPKTR
jgi:hypothetical protein